MDIRDINFLFHRAGDNNANFMLATIDDSSQPAYYGFLTETGAWMIMRKDDSAGEVKYRFGKTNFHTNWGNRATLSYYWYNEAVDYTNLA